MPGSKPDRPNIIVILADDLGWGDPGCNNPDTLVPMPSVDSIADNGVRFTNAHAASTVCTPSRYALLTGRYCWRTWLQEGVFYGYCRHLIEPERPTIASMLKGAGYATAVVGKWHLGLDWARRAGDEGHWPSGTAIRGRAAHEIGRRIDFTRPVTNGPRDLGFDYFFGTAACSTCNSPYVFIENDRPVVEPVWMSKAGVAEHPVMMDPDWSHDVVDDVHVEQAISFMENRRKSRPLDPFFLYLPLSAPHAPWVAAVTARDQSRDGPRGDMCVWADQSVGKIKAALDRLAITDDTLLIFTSDNGSTGNWKSWRNMSETWSDQLVNGPYRGYKTDIWDGGSRIPFVAQWPGHIKAGTITEVEFCLGDLFASLASLVGAGASNEQDQQAPYVAAPDSFDLCESFFGRAPKRVRDNLITHSYAGVYSIRIDQWKLILDTQGSGGDRNVTPGWQEVVPGSPGQLYDLSEDPYETRNLWADKPELVGELTYHIQHYRQSGQSR